MTSSTIATPVSRFVDTGTTTLGIMCATKQGPKSVFQDGRESFVKKVLVDRKLFLEKTAKPNTKLKIKKQEI